MNECSTIDKTLYQLTYFDIKEKARKKYLNGTSFTNTDEAELEFGRIMKDSDRKSEYCISADRDKWALEVIIFYSDGSKKRITVKQLS